MISSFRSALHLLTAVVLLIGGGCGQTGNRGGSAEGDDPYYNRFPIYAEMTPEREAVADTIRSLFDRLHKSGFNGTVLFAENGEIVFSHAYGFADLRRRDSLSMGSAFQLASISKPITALAVMILKEEGRLDLDDSLNRYVPELPYPGITLRHLLTHRSGLPNYMYFAEDLWPDKSIPLRNRDVIDLMVKHDIKRYYLPDKRYNYSNTNYAVLAYIVEKIAGERFEDFVNSRIFKPLRMDSARIYNKNIQYDNPNPVVGYPSTRYAAENSFLNGVVGDKGVYASAYDLLKLDKALYSDKLVSQATLRDAFTSQHADLRPNDNYGLGWRLNVSDSLNPAVYHTGWWKGFRTYFIRQTGEKRTIIILSNTLKASRFNTSELCEIY